MSIFQSRATNAVTRGNELRWLVFTLALSILSTLVVSTPSQASVPSTLTTCVDLTTLKERISKNGTCRTPQEAIAKWRLAPSDSSLSNSVNTKYLTICSNKASSSVTYQLIRSKCARHQQQNIYTRSAALPEKPVIIRVLSLSHESASLALATESATASDAPIAYYTIATSKGEVKKVYSWKDLTLFISGLSSSTSYTFTVSATNADGTSPFSDTSLPVTTQAFIAPQPTSVQVSSTPPAPSCANGGVACLVGDVGPGGGRVFYVATAPFACGPTRSESCLYLEAAPAGWNGGTSDPRRTWAKYPFSNEAINNPSSPETATATEIGWGYHNTHAIILQGNTEAATSAAALADSYAPSVGGVIVDDWYLPSKDELTQMCKWQRGLAWVSDATECLGGARNTGVGAAGFAYGFYWGSSEGKGFYPEGGANEAWQQPMDPDWEPRSRFYYGKDLDDRVRPIRAFGTFAESSAPSFTLSRTAETIYARTTPIIGYTITASGGTITSYSISPSVSAGLTFNPSTGILSGTPTETRTTTMYTITGSNSSGSATETFILRVAGSIGDVGPGGGTIFYVATTPFPCGPARASMCNYLETAQDYWAYYLDPALSLDPRRTWANNTYESTTVSNASPPETATGTAIGWGYWNTRAIVLQGNTDTSASAAALADSYISSFYGSELGDWFLPSKDELNQMYEGLGTGFFEEDHSYWSSSEHHASGDGAWEQSLEDGSAANSEKNENLYVRPIRTF
jgi:hypothetical protein